MSNPFYKELANEKVVFKTAFSSNIPLLLKGPTGCGKSRFVEAMAYEVDKEVVTVSCNDETSATDLIGRHLIIGGETVWQDGPVTRAVKNGHILYLDEIAEAREDVITVLHSLSDHRRKLFVDRLGEQYDAAAGFMMIVSFNPGYQKSMKEMKPSTRQRFVSLNFNYPGEEAEAQIIEKETGLNLKDSKKLAKLATKIRSLHELGLAETVSTRLLVNAAKLIIADLPPRLACDVSIVESLSDDEKIIETLKEIVSLII
ncbi:MAG: CbbQ/NirQ/NorQ/GpvN family protein [Halobacteriovoraceae bacterium]|jgi:nitric oxide reductase NorQ protein|nr:CbbQ/NirQ/NorQ/GpvN family protein [Halobacteriovoraceae bacterium]